MSKYTFVSLALACSVSASAVAAQDPDVGEGLFQQYCAQCHGDGGRGNGPVAQFLTVPPSDLTVLSANNDGQFPMLRVVQTIDGRMEVGPHGGAMPIWGFEFSEYLQERIGYYAAVIETRGMIMSLALYLEGIQQ